MSIFDLKRKSTLLERRVGYAFKDKNLLECALRHRSFINETANEVESNERLEFLGDAVLEFLVSEHLYREFPSRAEGELTELRRILVNGDSLAAKALELELARDILLSSGEAESGGREKPSILADAYEALLGAIFLDGGMKAARRFVEKVHLSNRDEFLTSEEHRNYKGMLLERLQAIGKTPRYSVISSCGPDHSKEFVVAVFSSGEELGRGKGGNKKSAEQAAARDAIEKLKKRSRLLNNE